MYGVETTIKSIVKKTIDFATKYKYISIKPDKKWSHKSGSLGAK